MIRGIAKVSWSEARRPWDALIAVVLGPFIAAAIGATSRDTDVAVALAPLFVVYGIVRLVVFAASFRKAYLLCSEGTIRLVNEHMSPMCSANTADQITGSTIKDARSGECIRFGQGLLLRGGLVEVDGVKYPNMQPNAVVALLQQS